MADAPQVLHADHHLQTVSSDKQPLEYRYGDVLSPGRPEVLAKEEYPTHGNGGERRPATILGLRKRNFWMLAGIAVIVIAIAVGASVGGSLAVRNSGSSKSKPEVSSGPTSPTNQPASSGSPTSSDTAYTPVPPSNVSLIDVSCPASSFVFTDSKTFRCIKDTDMPGADVIRIVAYTLQDCAEACSNMNSAGVETCKAVVVVGNMSAVYNQQHANCFLKKELRNTAGQKGSTMVKILD